MRKLKAEPVILCNRLEQVAHISLKNQGITGNKDKY